MAADVQHLCTRPRATDSGNVVTPSATGCGPLARRTEAAVLTGEPLHSGCPPNVAHAEADIRVRVQPSRIRRYASSETGTMRVMGRNVLALVERCMFGLGITASTSAAPSRTSLTMSSTASPCAAARRG